MARTEQQVLGSNGRGRRGPWLMALTLALVGFVPVVSSAQSSIAGIVRDTSGGVLPGVTVEATSPALIEKVRTAVTDGEGRYNIIDLRPGTYVVTFTLPGFSTLRHDGIVLPSGFTATVNAELRVGALEETITVIGETPVVDVQSVARQETLSKELLEAVPTGRLPQNYTALLPGAVQNAAAQTALGGSYLATVITFHGRQESQYFLDGFNTSHHMSDRGQHALNQGTIEEIVVSAGSGTAEQQYGGLVTNAIPKEGGNTFSGQVYFHFANEDFLGNNLTDELRAIGARTQSTRLQRDFNPAVGGPVLRDRLWFFASFRDAAAEVDANSRFDVDPLDWIYTPDLSRPTVANRLPDRNYSLRLTLQATPRNKVAFFYDYGPRFDLNRGASATVAPEATTFQHYVPQYLTALTWKSPVSTRIFVEGGTQYLFVRRNIYPNFREPMTKRPVSPDLFAVGAQDLDRGVLFRGAQANQLGIWNETRALRSRAAAAYVTGTHTFKVGMELARGSYFVDQHTPNYYTVALRSGVPVQLNLEGHTQAIQRIAAALGLYAQHQWTLQRATLNVGVRYDYFNTDVPTQEVPASRFLPALRFDAVGQVLGLHDLSPRLGVSHDLFGTGRTAIKATVNRYPGLEGVNSSLTGLSNPAQAIVLAATRAFTDRNGDFIPDCDFSNPTANGECGPLSNLNFGQRNPRATVVDPALLKGWGHRAYNWETSAAIQHELIPGLAVHTTYVRRWFGNLTATDNLSVEPADFDPYCINVPADPRVPGGGGYQQCGYYDVKPAKFGQVQNFITYASNFGQQKEVYTGVDVTVSARLPNGAQITGGTNTARLTNSRCFVVDSPQEVLFCDVKPPFQTMVKLMGTYPLPWGIRLSGVFQSLPGPEISTATIIVRSAQIAPTLGRNLSAGANATVTLPLLQPGTVYGKQYNELDVRFSKTFRVAQYRLVGSLDAFNLLNGVGIIAVNTRYGPAFRNPTSALGARLFRISTQIDF